MEFTLMSKEEMKNEIVGAAITLAAVLAVLVTAVIAVVVYKLFTSSKGSANVAGWKFTWN